MSPELYSIKGGQDHSNEIDVDNLLDIQKEMLKTINYVDEYSWKKGELGGLDWGIEAFNQAFDGLQPGLMMIAGQPNIGKSALCMNLAWTIANSNKEVTEKKPNKAYVIYFSLDDNDTELLPRFIAIDQKIPINVVKAPKKYEDDVVHMARREDGINNLKGILDHFKIIDSKQGTSIEFIEEQIKRHQMELHMKDESYKIVAIVDNFHDITVDSQNFSSENKRYDHIAGEISRISTMFDIPFLCTGEFRKLNGNRRPIVDDVRETVKIAYEAKAILLCYNEVGLRGDASSVYWQKPGEESKQPVMEVKIGKNKYSSFKHRIFFEFMPAMSYLKEVPLEGAKRYNQMIIG
jgi:replicative DNA helicase